MEFYILVDLTTYYAVYSGGHISWLELFLAGNQGNYHNLVLFMLTNNIWLIFMGMKQKKI